jgi:hypothetical protein
MSRECELSGAVFGVFLEQRQESGEPAPYSSKKEGAFCAAVRALGGTGAFHAILQSRRKICIGISERVPALAALMPSLQARSDWPGDRVRPAVAEPATSTKRNGPLRWCNRETQWHEAASPRRGLGSVREMLTFLST